MSLISVDEALARCMADVTALPSETVALVDSDNRVLAQPLQATRTQPPFDAAAMDGYAVRAGDAAHGATLNVIGQSAAGHAYSGVVGRGQAVRIFTGAPMPEGADAIVIQENVTRDDAQIVLTEGSGETRHIRMRGVDFFEGDALLAAGTRLGPRAVTLAAAMGHDVLPVTRRPRVAVIATGDELVLPGTPPNPDQIVCSNPFGIMAMLIRAGAETSFIGIAEDTEPALHAHLDRAADADLVITIGGASVGDHDLVAPTLRSRGVAFDFWKIAMRPGKPLMFGRKGPQRFLGLPGNPVSSLICARVFAYPLIHGLLGLAWTGNQQTRAILTDRLEANGPRRHYMRAISKRSENGDLSVAPVSSQDSSLLATLNRADALIVREAHAPVAEIAEPVTVLLLDF
ncbi:MAG: gephyrin-like molybdotransferase Glp [Pseudomonadota bacterium]